MLLLDSGRTRPAPSRPGAHEPCAPSEGGSTIVPGRSPVVRPTGGPGPPGRIAEVTRTDTLRRRPELRAPDRGRRPGRPARRRSTPSSGPTSSSWAWSPASRIDGGGGRGRGGPDHGRLPAADPDPARRRDRTSAPSPASTGSSVTTGVMDAEQRRRSWPGPACWPGRRPRSTDIPDTARVIAIASGKGGVGKSSVTVNLAVALARRGLTVGVLDADIWGFSVPRLLGMQGEIEARDKKMVPLERRVGRRAAAGAVHGLPGRRGQRHHVAGPDPQPGRPAVPRGRPLGRPRLPAHRHAARAPATSRWAWPACCPAPRSSW